MNPFYGRLIILILAELLFVLLPFFAIFRKEWRFTAVKITGILFGYLFFVCIVTLLALKHYWNHPYFSNLWAVSTAAANIAVTLLLVKCDLQVIIYSLFLFKNFADTAGFCADLSTAASNIPKIMGELSFTEVFYHIFFLFLMVWAAYYLLHRYLLDAVEYTRPLPVWKYLASIPVIFFVMFRLFSGSLSPNRIINYHPDMLMFAVCWFTCIYTVHFVSLRILSRLSQSYAAREQYRTTKLLINVQTSQMATLQHSLEQLKKARHDFRHHLITIRGLLDQKEPGKAADYISEYLGSAQKLETVQYCSNLSANALLNYYIETARSQDILVSSSISLPSALPVPEIDFCTILGNLLSNALESCLRQTSGQPSIRINIGQAGESMLALSIHNTYTHSIRQKEGRFLSSKRSDLGMGTLSVRYLVERYHGILKYNYENGIFEASLLLNPTMK